MQTQPSNSNNSSSNNSNSQNMQNQNTSSTTTNNNNLNNSKMGNFNFTTKTVKVSDLKIHELLEELGYKLKLEDVFSDTAAYFNFYKKPVVDKSNNVITNSAEVLAAQKNGLKTIEVFECDLNGEDLRRFISFTHKYHRKNLVATYKAIKFYENYLGTAEGIELAKSIGGNSTREKIAKLLQTSDSTVKRVKQVGEKRPHSLPLIQNRDMSFEEVIYDIKKERLAKKVNEEENSSTYNEDDLTEQDYVAVEQDIKDDFTDSTTNDESDDFKEEDFESTESPKPTSKKQTKVIPLSGSEASNEKPQILKLLKAALEIEGLGKIDIQNVDGRPAIFFNGQNLQDVEYEMIDNPSMYRDSNTTSFVLSQSNGFSINLTIENYANQIKKAA